MASAESCARDVAARLADVKRRTFSRRLRDARSYPSDKSGFCAERQFVSKRSGCQQYDSETDACEPDLLLHDILAKDSTLPPVAY
jgi:hypothetical protein